MHQQVAMYVVRTLDTIVNEPYVVAYFHTLTGAENLPQTSFLRDMHEILDKR